MANLKLSAEAKEQKVIKQALLQSIRTANVRVPMPVSESARAPDLVRERRRFPESVKLKLKQGAIVTEPSQLFMERQANRVVVGGAAPSTKGVCRPPGKRGKGKRACLVELTWINRADARRLGTATGPNLRLCSMVKQKGMLIPVQNHQEANRLSRQFCECVGDEGTPKRRTQCAKQLVGGKTVRTAMGRAR